VIHGQKEHFMDMILGEVVMVCHLKVLGLILFVASFGPPLPASVLLINAGALIQRGQLSFLLVVLVGSGMAIMGDLGAYRLACWGGAPVLRVVGSHRLAPAEHVLRQRGALGLFLSRWLLTPVGPALNLVCGLTRYPFRRFATLITVGQLVWVIGYVLLGRIFSSQIQQLTALMRNLSGLTMLLLLGGGGLVVLGRTVHARRVRNQASRADA
jgi:membrane-associated protein